MSKQPIIYILSDNRDFIEPLSSLVTRELKLECREAATEAGLSAENMALLVTDRELARECQFPVITVNLPIRINKLLIEIEEKINNISNQDTLEIGSDLWLSLQHKSLSHKPSGETADLTDKESQLLQIIAQAGEGGISRESLLKEVWKIDSALDTHTLETHIYRLRKKIKDAFDIEIIRAFDGGYRL